MNRCSQNATAARRPIAEPPAALDTTASGRVYVQPDPCQSLQRLEARARNAEVPRVGPDRLEMNHGTDARDAPAGTDGGPLIPFEAAGVQVDLTIGG